MEMESPNSISAWRHAPHGEIGRLPPTIANATNSFSPAVMAPAIALRSAQIVNPYDALSMLHPAKISPELAINPAPTRRFEEGAYARARA